MQYGHRSNSCCVCIATFLHPILHLLANFFCPLRQRSGFSTVEFVELQTNRTRRHPILHLLANFFALCASGVALAQSSSSSCRPTGHVGQLVEKGRSLTEFE